MPTLRSRVRSIAVSVLFVGAVLILAGGCQSAAPQDAKAREGRNDTGAEGTPSGSRFALAIENARARLYADPYVRSTESATEATENFLSGLIESAWRMAHAARYLGTPRFGSGAGIVGLPGLFNPDNLYTSALLEPDGVYRISGRRGSHERFTLQFLDAYPLVGLSKGLMVVDLDELGVEPGDDFSVRVGGTKSGSRDELWWPMPEGARAVLSRQTFNDWTTETPTRLRIDRLDDPGDIPRGPAQADLAADYLDRITALWAESYLAGLQRLPENAFPPIRASGDQAGGLSGQQGVITRYRLAENEALVVTVRASDAAYQSIQLGDYWFATQNPVEYPSSLNRSQASVDADGLIRFVISHGDPGVANWLATAGADRGYVMIRWQGIRTPLGPEDRPLAVRVPRSGLNAVLPADTVRVTPEERDAQLATRIHLPALKQ